MYHKEFPWNKGLWIWQMKSCLNGDVDAIIKKCHDFDISYVLIKNGDGGNLWTQLTHDIISRFQNANIKVYSWTYNYGYDPIAEANVAMQCLSLGVNGHVFDAESEFEYLANNAHAAEVMLQAIRARYPDKFLAHAPYPFISVHRNFPYMTFGKYYDAVMPQVYFGTMNRIPQDAIVKMYNDFVDWENRCKAEGHADSIKPIIPIAQAYDNYQVNPAYILKPADIHTFVSIVKGYKSVNFWSFQHILRDDCWAAIRDAKVDQPSDADRGIVHSTPVEQPVQTTTEAPVEQPVQETVTQVQSGDTTVTVVEETPVEQSAPVVEATPEPTQTVTPQAEPQRIELPTSISVPVSSQPTTVTFKPNKEDPEKVDVIVHPHKTHREYFVDFVRYVVSLFKGKNKE